ncbi:unnamed protein product [Rodentolepis nana]|uniref:DUF3987 domain-containing protein n=1 Tax=Rodentolepis nana TaxID=102285 RepID=A0A0R3U017_RODNA|nr:unnamed protein product [Rodentolepis nana]
MLDTESGGSSPFPPVGYRSDGSSPFPHVGYICLNTATASILGQSAVSESATVHCFFFVRETTFVNSSIGVQWGEVARQQIRALNNERLAKEKTNAYLRNLSKLQHYCHVKHREDIGLGASWLIAILSANIVDIGSLLGDITNTGEALLASLITSHPLIGTVCRRGDQTAFHFDNLLSRTVALMDEPRVTTAAKND